MAFTEKQEYKVEVIPPFNHVQVRRADIVLKDNKEVGRTFHRECLLCGDLDASDNLVETDVSSKPQVVKDVCAAVWTTDVKNAWKAELIANKP